MTQQHTPTPWTLKQGREIIHEFKTKDDAYNGGSSEWLVATVKEHGDPTMSAEDRANAAFIVKACNHHAELVDALENLLEDLKVTAFYEWPNAKKARAILAKVQACS